MFPLYDDNPTEIFPLFTPGGGGVASLAHIGGFVAGVVLIFLFRKLQLVEAKRSGVTLRRHELDHGGWW